MNAGSLCLLLLTMMVSAQTIRDEVIVTRLNSDLMALKFLPSLPNGKKLPDLVAMTREDRAALAARVANRNPDQHQVILRYADAMAKLYEETVIPWDLAYALTSVLAGKNLSNHTLTPLTSAILEAVDRAFVCRDTQSDLGKSPQFRASIELAYDALLALDVSHPNARIVAGGLLESGKLIRARGPRLPFIRPIPPVLRPMSPQQGL
jgi:hypothetical protein